MVVQQILLYCQRHIIIIIVIIINIQEYRKRYCVERQICLVLLC